MARLRELVRETDLLGQMDSGDCAVLLPDTNALGSLGFITRIGRALRGAGEPELAMRAATYPDQLFDNLDAGRELVPLGSLMLDDTGPATRAGYAGKRTLDLAGAALALLVLGPVMAAVALAVALTSPGPVVFRQLRLGRDGAPFVFYKFRTMTHGADDAVHLDFVARLIAGTETGAAPPPQAAAVEAEAEAEAEQGSFKIQQDPRVTPLGRFLRRTSLDELPQLFNVLRGDMSLVGPRPPIPYEARHYRAWHLRRLLQVKPGITGPWQVAGRSQVPFDDMVRMDLRYIARCQQRQVQGARARVHGRAEGPLAVGGELVLEGLHLGAEREVAAVEHAGNGRINVGTDAAHLRLQVDEGDGCRKGCRIGYLLREALGDDGSHDAASSCR